MVASSGGKEFPPALNEIYITRTNLTKTEEIEIMILSRWISVKDTLMDASD